MARASSAAWRIAATHTHLYPGARLAPLDGSLDAPPRGAAVTIEFADQRIAHGKVTAAAATRVVLDVAPYATARGTAIDRKTWTLARDSAATTQWKVVAKGAAPAAPRLR